MIVFLPSEFRAPAARPRTTIPTLFDFVPYRCDKGRETVSSSAGGACSADPDEAAFRTDERVKNNRRDRLTGGACCSHDPRAHVGAGDARRRRANSGLASAPALWSSVLSRAPAAAPPVPTVVPDVPAPPCPVALVPTVVVVDEGTPPEPQSSRSRRCSRTTRCCRCRRRSPLVPPRPRRARRRPRCTTCRCPPAPLVMVVPVEPPEPTVVPAPVDVPPPSRPRLPSCPSSPRPVPFQASVGKMSSAQPPFSTSPTIRELRIASRRRRLAANVVARSRQASMMSTSTVSQVSRHWVQRSGDRCTTIGRNRTASCCHPCGGWLGSAEHRGHSIHRRRSRRSRPIASNPRTPSPHTALHASKDPDLAPRGKRIQLQDPSRSAATVIASAPKLKLLKVPPPKFDLRAYIDTRCSLQAANTRGRRARCGRSSRVFLFLAERSGRQAHERAARVDGAGHHGSA